MEGWKTIKIGELGTIITGKTPKTSIADNYGGATPFLSPSDDLSGKYVPDTARTLSENGVAEVKNCLLPAHSICVSCIGSDLGKSVVTTGPVVTNQQFNSIIPNAEFDSDFVYYLMQLVGPIFNNLSKTSTAVPIINKSTFSSFEVKVPSFDTQCRISRILSSIDDKIELNNRINHNLEEQLSSKYESLLSNSSHRVNLSNFANKISDGVHNTVIDSADGTFNLLSCKNLKDGRVVINDVERKISKETFQILRRRTQLEQWDILLSSVGTIGEIVLLKEDPSKYEFQRSVAMIKACDKQDACIIYSALKRQKNELIHSAHGAVQQCLFLSDIKGFEIEVPTKRNTIDEFGKYAIAVHNAIAKNQKESIVLGTLRDSLLTHLMSGELNITEIDC